ncbi:MAG: universal stress protein [Paludibacteraceae bacterium]
MIKTVLEQNDIETVIHNLNLENPETAVGVRVRIKEKDLPAALSIVEEVEKEWEKQAQKENPLRGKTILIPVGLSDQINAVCKYGFHYAKKLEAHVVFLHAYLTPAYTITSASNTEINTYSLTDTETLRRIVRTNNADVENLTNLIKKWIDSGEIPNVNFRFEMREGVAEDEILAYCKKEMPALIIMGTHSKHPKGDNMLGSVTAEVLEASPAPVMAISSEIEMQPDDIRRVAFLTNFDQKDLIAIDSAISFLKNDNFEMTFIHAAEQKDSWDEVMLSGIKTYFANHYPDVKTDYAFLRKDGNLDRIQSFLETSKIDLVALNTKKRSLIARFFNQGIATKLLFNIDTPLLVMRV